jgi:surface antigen
MSRGTWRRSLTTLGVVSAFLLANMSPGTFASADEISQAERSSQLQTVSLTGTDTAQSASLQRAEATASAASSARLRGKFAKSAIISGTPSLSQVLSAIGLPARSQVASIQNDYPYAGRYGGNSPFGYVYGNCTDFVAWRINRDAGVTSAPWRFKHDLTPAGGNGGQWSYSQNLSGWGFGTLDTVRAGDIVSFPMSGLMGTSRVYGHVAYVAAVLSDGSLITENYGGGNYFVEYLAASDLSQWLSSRGIVIRTQP